MIGGTTHFYDVRGGICGCSINGLITSDQTSSGAFVAVLVGWPTAVIASSHGRHKDHAHKETHIHGQDLFR